jgi:hypothetical protein
MWLLLSYLAGRAILLRNQRRYWNIILVKKGAFIDEIIRVGVGNLIIFCIILHRKFYIEYKNTLSKEKRLIATSL